MPGKSINDKTIWTGSMTEVGYDPFGNRWENHPASVENQLKNEDAVEYQIKGSHRTIQDFEKIYPQLAEEFKNIQNEQYELFAAKMMDYGLSNISLGSNLDTREDRDLSLTGIWLRCNDKINRLKNMLKRNGKNYVQGEAMIDSFIDISNYGIIAMLVLRGKWK
tara:strand:- start:40 stop:531 length:492 start_codon:yes stop_codon:yes gene_type:complete